MAVDIVEQLRSLTYMDDAAAACQQAADEIVRLRRWKSEATAVIERWEAAWEAAGSPGQLGDAKSDALRDEVLFLRHELDDRNNRIHDYVGTLEELHDTYVVRRRAHHAERALADQLAAALRDAHGTATRHAVCWCSTDSEYPSDCDSTIALAAYEAARKEEQ